MKRRGGKIGIRLKFTEEEMRNAVLRIVEDGESLNTVSNEVGLCKKTLKSYLDKYLSTAADKKGEFVFRPNYEINQVFTHELEKIFEQYLLNVDKTVQRVNRAFLRKAAFEFAMTCNAHVPKTWNVRKQAGLDWMYGFLNRHPVIKRLVIANKKEKTLKNDIVLVDVPDENYVEETVEEVVALEDVNIANVDISTAPVGASATSIIKSEPTQTRFNRYNTESNLPDFLCVDVPKSAGIGSVTRLAKSKLAQCEANQYDVKSDFSDSVPKIFESITDFQVISIQTATEEFEENLREAYCTISLDGYVPSDRVFNLDEIALVVENPNHEKVVVTACCCIAANGCALPPFMIFPRPKFHSLLLTGYAAGVCGVASSEGVIDDHLFLLVLQHFRDLTHTSPHHKAVLIIDDDDCHVTVGTIDFCQRWGIELVTLPPQSAGRLQPIEKHVYKTLKSYFNTACTKFRSLTADQVVSVYDVSILFNTIYPLAFTKEKIIYGFNETGLYPLDGKMFAEVDALPMKLVTNDLPAESLVHNVELVLSGIRSSDASDASEEEVESADKISEGAVAVEDEESSSLVSQYERKLAKNFEETPVAEYFNGLTFGFDELETHGGISADRVFNMDEIELVVRMSENEDSGLRIVSCCCVSAAGKSVPPLFVYPGVDAPPDSGIEGARSYSIDQFEHENDIFVAMLEHFVEHVSPTPQNRVLLVTDDEHCHVTVKSIDFCFEHGIILVTVPAQAHVPLQPLEKTLFNRLTINFSAECDRFMDENDGRLITMADMIVIFKNVYEEAFNADAITDSFMEAGIWPLNEDKINAASFS